MVLMAAMRTQSLLLLVLASFLVSVIAAPVRSSTYIIHMENNVSHVDVTMKEAWYRELMHGAKTVLSDEEEDDGKECVHHVYDNVFNGFSARLTPEQVAYMENLPGVLGLHLNRIHYTQTTHSPDFLGLTGPGAKLWNESDYGEGVIIGVIDTGIWPERPSFHDHGLGPIPKKWKGICESGIAFETSACNNKLIGARYILTTYEDEVGPVGVTNDFRSPRDYDGHGTHTASTAAGRQAYPAVSQSGLAKGTASGMAPKARIAVYKAMWGKPSQGTTSDLVKAIELAVADGVDVISYSITGHDTLDDPVSIAIYNAIKCGVFFSAAGGNTGPGATTVKHIAPWITTVAATTMDREFVAKVELGNGKRLDGNSAFDARLVMENNKLPLIWASDAAANESVKHQASICQNGTAYLNAALIVRKFVVCDKTDDTNYQDIVPQSGASGVVLATATAVDGESAIGLEPTPTPVSQLGTDGTASLRDYTDSSTGSATARIRGAKTLLGVKPAPKVATFSARGPLNYTRGQWLKPDISAPGVYILAAGVKFEYYTFKSGTSMACPHISGIGALLKSVYPHWSPAAIRSALMTSATTLDNEKNTITAQENNRTATPWAFGAGLTQPEKALNPGLIYDIKPIDYFNFLCALGYPTDTLKRFESKSTCPAHARIEDLNLPSFVAEFDANAITSKTSVYFTRTVTNVGSEGYSVYTPSIVHPAGYSVTVEPSKLYFTAHEPCQTYTLCVTPVDTKSKPGGSAVGSIKWLDGVHIVRSPIVAYQST